jgi:hypothetical protein
MSQIRTVFSFLQKQTWLAVLLCVLPVVVYFNIFFKIALNVNYVAYDDILILGVIPGFEEAGWLERWHKLTDPFPEHRLVFSRSIVLLSYFLFGQVNLYGLMVIGNLCWLACAGVFYAVFRRMQLSLWYFVPVTWLWFTLHSFENIFWGVSSLCNFGVLFFAMLAFYFTTHRPRAFYAALLCALAATFTYGNGILVFVVIAVLVWISGRRREFLLTVFLTALIGYLYFAGFPQKTPSLDFTNPQQVREGVAAFFGFIGSITALDAYSVSPLSLGSAVATGVIMATIFLVLFWSKFMPLVRSLVGKPLVLSPTGQFALAVLLFVALTSFVVLYKRIPLGGFQALFKGRYRMYSSLGWVALHFGALAWLVADKRRAWGVFMVFFGITINLLLLYANFTTAVNNRRGAVVQEFNSRYNADWLGLRMFNMSQQHFESIRSYYQSGDPLAEGWNPRASTDSLPCAGTFALDTIYRHQEEIQAFALQDFVEVEKDYTDGPYLILKSDRHVYASTPNQSTVPLRTVLRRQMYFAKGFQAVLHEATVEPGVYRVYVLMRRNGQNYLYCTNRTWVETD